jgi:CHAD domain-containing protein
VSTDREQHQGDKPIATVVREVERKYDPGEAGNAALDAVRSMPGVAGVASVSGQDEQILDAVYYDTADLRLIRAGITLRRRTGGEDAGWHLKLPAGAGARDEIRLPLSVPAGSAARAQAADPVRPPAGGKPAATRDAEGAVPEELTDLVRACTRDAPVAPVVRIRTSRQAFRLLDSEDRTLAEIAADHVRAEPADGSDGTSWDEIEAELVAGDLELLTAIDARLRAAGAQAAPTATKLERALGDRLPVLETRGRSPLTARSPAAEMVLAYLRDQATAIARCDPQVRRDEPDAVHHMRVATRRARSVLQAFGQIIERETTRPLCEELKWLAATLGRVRDSEVLLTRFTAELAAIPPALVVGPVHARIITHFSTEHAEARTAALRALDGQRYLRVLGDLDALLADPPLAPLAGNPAGKVLAGPVRRARRRLQRALAAVPGAEDRDAAIHEARKAAKRARYAAEAAVPALGSKAERQVAWTRELQELLGDHHDSVVARIVLLDLTEQARAAGQDTFTYGLMHQRQACQASEIERSMPRHRADRDR